VGGRGGGGGGRRGGITGARGGEDGGGRGGGRRDPQKGKEAGEISIRETTSGSFWAIESRCFPSSTRGRKEEWQLIECQKEGERSLFRSIREETKIREYCYLTREKTGRR